MASREDLIRELKSIRSEQEPESPNLLGSVGRGLIKAPGSIVDIGLLPYNIYAGFNDLEPFSVAEKSAELYDKATGNKYKPNNLGQKATETASEFIGGGFGLAKLVGKSGTKAGKAAAKYLAPKTAQDYAALGTAGIGSAIGQEALPNNPIAGSIGGGLAGGLIPGAVKAGAQGIKSIFAPNSEEVLKAVAKLKEIPEKGTLATRAVTNLQEKAAREKAPITEKYNKATSEAGDIAISEIKAFPTLARQTLNAEGYINEKNIGKLAHGYVKSFNSMFANTKGVDGVTGVNRNALEKWRQGINKSIRNLEKTNPDNQEITSLNRLKEIAREWETDLTRRGLSSNPESLANYDIANKEYAKWATKYKNKSDAGKKFIYKIINTPKEDLIPENIANDIFGKANTGFKKDTPFIISELDKVIPEQMDLVRQEGLIKMFKPLLENDTEKASRYLIKYIQDHATTLKSLYGKDTLKQMGKLAKQWLANPDPNMVINFISKFPWAGKILSTTLRSQENMLSVTPTIINGINNTRNEQEFRNPNTETLINELMQLRQRQ